MTRPDARPSALHRARRSRRCLAVHAGAIEQRTGDRVPIAQRRCVGRPLAGRAAVLGPAAARGLDLAGTDADVVCRCGQRVGSGRFTAAPRAAASARRVLRFVDDSALEVSPDRVGHRARRRSSTRPRRSLPWQIEVVTGDARRSSTATRRSPERSGSPASGWRSDHPRWLGACVIDESDAPVAGERLGLGRSTSTRACPTSSSRCLRRTSRARHRSSRGRDRPRRGHHARRLLRSAAGSRATSEPATGLRGGHPLLCRDRRDRAAARARPVRSEPLAAGRRTSRAPVTFGRRRVRAVRRRAGDRRRRRPNRAARRLAPRPDRARRPRADRRAAAAGSSAFAGRRARPDRVARRAARAAAAPDLALAGWVRQRRRRALPPVARRRTPDDARDCARCGSTPSAFAAGIIAATRVARRRRTRVRRTSSRPASCARAVPVADVEHDELHPNGINVFVTEARRRPADGGPHAERGCDSAPAQRRPAAHGDRA